MCWLPFGSGSDSVFRIKPLTSKALISWMIVVFNKKNVVKRSATSENRKKRVFLRRRNYCCSSKWWPEQDAFSSSCSRRCRIEIIFLKTPFLEFPFIFLFFFQLESIAHTWQDGSYLFILISESTDPNKDFSLDVTLVLEHGSGYISANDWPFLSVIYLYEYISRN